MERRRFSDHPLSGGHQSAPAGGPDLEHEDPASRAHHPRHLSRGRVLVAKMMKGIGAEKRVEVAGGEGQGLG